MDHTRAIATGICSSILLHKKFMCNSNLLLQAAAATSSASCGALWRIAAPFAAHLRRNSAIAAHFEGKNGCGGAFFCAAAATATIRKRQP